MPLTDQVVFDHCAGTHVVGLYPLQTNDTCRLLAIDFDDKDWRDDARSFVETCHDLAVTCSLEISRSGKGAHVWLFFSRDLQAVIARQLGSALISRTCARRRQLSLASYDRLFPNQDRLPSGGFGNLIALPLQKNAREKGTTIFVDDDFQPFPDQWVYLSSIVPIDVDMVDEIIHRATEGHHPLDVSFIYEDTDDPWKMNALSRKVQCILPSVIDVVLSDRLYIAKDQLPQPLLNRIVRLAAFPNPEFYKAQSLRLSVWDKPRIIDCAENFPRHIAVPRGCLHDLENLLLENEVELRIKDERACGKPIAISFTGLLRPEQEAAVEAMLKHEHGVLNAPTAFGKTVASAALIARRGVNTLVLVHRRELQQQWKERLNTFLTLEAPGVGTIGGGANRPSGIVDIAVLQSLVRRENLRSFLETYGQIIIDECHHVSAISFEQVMKQCSSRYIMGLSATPIRRDGLAPIIFMQCGPIRYSGARSAILAQDMEVRLSSLACPAIPEESSIQSLFKVLSQDESRNISVCTDIINAFKEPSLLRALTRYPKATLLSSLPPAGLSVKVSIMPTSIHLSLPCPFHGKEHCSSMPAASIGSVHQNATCVSMIT
ncbi:MAG: DEAD/DEAH box helicase family protein [Rectinemataceae bacterium]